MATPNRYKKKVNLDVGFEGNERRREILKQITDTSTELPKGVLHDDLDLGFKNFVKEKLQVTFDEKEGPVPVIMMGIHGWNEFKETWKLADDYGNIKIPYINIVRKPETVLSEDRMLMFHTPGKYNNGREKYIYNLVETWDGNKRTYTAYKIPEPIPVDIEYNVRLFSYRQRELNKFNNLVINLFAAPPVYIVVNGHFIPLRLVNIGDESQIVDIDSKRFYVQNYMFVLEGIILDPDEFEVVEMSKLDFKLKLSK